MSGTSSVDFTTLYQAAKDVRSVKDEISGEVRNFDGTVGHMLSGWRGAAATAFQGLAGQWQQDIGRVLLALEGIADALEKSAGMHQQTDAPSSPASTRPDRRTAVRTGGRERLRHPHEW
jgi:WXG100 family type VII secretion target